MYDSVKTIILDYAQEHLCSMPLSWNTQEFKKQSYRQWIIHEIIERILDHPFDLPSETIENCLIEMYFYANLSGEDNERLFIFQTAIEATEEIIEVIKRYEKLNL